MTNEEIQERFKKILEIYEANEDATHFEEVKWFFDTLAVEDQTAFLLMAYNIIVCLARPGATGEKVSRAKEVAKMMVFTIEHMAKEVYPFLDPSCPISHLFMMMFKFPYIENVGPEPTGMVM